MAGTRNVEFRVEIFNLFNTVNFSDPVGTLPQAIPNNALTEVNRVQPGQPCMAAAAGTFGSLTSTGGLLFLNPASFATPTPSRRGRIRALIRGGRAGDTRAIVRSREADVTASIVTTTFQ